MYKHLLMTATALILASAALADEATNQSAMGIANEGPFVFGLQSTYIYQLKDAFGAPYTPGFNSLMSSSERSYSFTATALVGARLGHGTELYLNPEVYQAHVLSGLSGLAGPVDAEQQKGGSATGMTVYTARAFLRQTWDLGGDDVTMAPGLTEFAETVKSRRIVVSAGKLSVLDLFDTSPIVGDPRNNFLNWSFVTYGAYDYAADLRGYTSGLALEYYRDDWAFRYGRFQVPAEPNTSDMDNSFLRDFGEQIEVEHDHKIGELPGFVKVLVYRDVGNMGDYAASVVLANQQNAQPDISLTRSRNTKSGFGIHIEQAVTPDVTLFMRLSADNGKYEEASFAEIDRQLQFGISGSGASWKREGDNYGIGYAVNALSNAHKNYLAAGGLGAFLGDGGLNYHSEDILEAYYSFALPHHVQLAFDYQNIANPGYNADRHGPVNVFGVRLHYAYF